MVNAFESIAEPGDIFTDAPENRASVLDHQAAIKGLLEHAIGNIGHHQWELLRNAVDQEYGGNRTLDPDADAALIKNLAESQEALEAIHDFLFGDGPCYSCDEIDNATLPA